MKCFVMILYTLCLCAVDAASADGYSPIYGWTVSKSAADPFVIYGHPTGGVDTLFLWFSCALEGMSAAEMTLDSIPPGQVLGFNAMNGFLNAGNASNLLLAVGGCPMSPIVAGSILVLHLAPLAICIGGANVTVDCSLDPQAWPHERRGYLDFGGPPICLSDIWAGCDPISVEESSWGLIKSLYR